MNRRSTILTLVFLVVGLAALFVTPRILYPEPILVFRIGIGAGIALLCLAGVILVQVFLLGSRYRESRMEKSLDKVRESYETEHRRFIQRLNHEIKNPLTGLNTELANIQEQIKAGDDHRAIKNACRSLERINSLMEDLRKLSELDVKNIEHLPVDIPQLVKEMVTAAIEDSRYSGRTINTTVSQVPSPFPVVYGDRDLLGLAVFNILDNALKFTSAEDVIEARVREDGHSVVVEIADNGHGISADDQACIFDELYRGSNARGIAGSGLGLPIVKRIVQLHGGEITLRSRQGQPHATVFTIRVNTQNDR